MAAASNPLRFLPQIQFIRKLIKSGNAGRVLLVEGRLKENVSFTNKITLVRGVRNISKFGDFQNKRRVLETSFILFKIKKNIF